MWPNIIFGGTAVLFVGLSLASLWHLRWVRRLPALESIPGEPGPAPPPIQRANPHCSVVIAARDEADRVEGAIRHLLAQVGVDLEIIVVDDRSSDGTGEVLRRMAGEDSRLRVMRVDVLPADWLGKCHACYIGAKSATTDWILFTDADCWLEPTAILRALRTAEREQADHLTLTPGTVAEGIAARAWHLLFLTSLLNWFSGVNRDRPGAYLGIGAFNLVRRQSYRQCGGYEALRLTVLDDMKLGLILRRSGLRSRAYLGVGDVECHWGDTMGGVIRIMEKNYFAAVDFRLGLALGASGVMLIFLRI